MFFMVLDLRLVKIGCRETINFFVYIPMFVNSCKYKKLATFVNIRKQ